MLAPMKKVIQLLAGKLLAGIVICAATVLAPNQIAMAIRGDWGVPVYSAVYTGKVWWEENAWSQPPDWRFQRLIGGHDQGRSLVVCSALRPEPSARGGNFFYGSHPGRLVEGEAPSCRIGYGGREISVRDTTGQFNFKVLWHEDTNLIWVAGPGIPPGAVIGGSEQGVEYPVCRAAYQNGIHPGKLHRGICHIGYGGQEILLPHFEVLAQSPRPPLPITPFMGCQAMSDTYGTSYGKDWGTAPDDLVYKWRGHRCNTSPKIGSMGIKGRFANSIRVHCNPGWFQPALGHYCQLCPFGSVAPNSGATTCSSCLPGSSNFERTGCLVPESYRPTAPPSRTIGASPG